MTKSRIKTIVIFLFLISLSAALYLTSQKSKWDLGWDKGLLSISERNYYSNRINRIIEYWQRTRDTVKHERNGRLDESYNAYLVVDLNKKAMWIEENGQICTENYIDFPPETEWTFYRSFPGGNTELLGKTILKIRGSGGKYITPERFYLVGNGTKGYIASDFSSKNTYYNPGSFKVRSYKLPTYDVNDDERFGSMVVTQDEYKQYLETLPDSNAVVVENEKIKAWNKIEKYLYMEMERQFPKKGYKLGSVSIKPGPDYSAARAYINIRKKNILEKITGNRSKNHGYNIYIDHIGGDIWYGKSVYEPYSGPFEKEEKKPILDFEFLASPTGFIKGSKHKEILKKGREFQLATVIPESKWKTTLSNGTKFEFLGIHENTNSDTHWWGPDGSFLDYTPTYNNEPYDKYFIDKNIFEVAWRTTPSTVSYVTLEGCMSDYSHQVIDRYGNIYPALLGVKGFSFRNRPQMTTFKAKLSITDWKVPLQITNKSGEINFLDKKRIILNPPEIVNEQLIVKCYEERNIKLTKYKTDFAIIVNSGSETKTVPLTNFEREWPHRVKEGMEENAYIIKDYNINQIEGVCFRYQPYSYIIFKNISLVPGEDFGVEIEVLEAEE